MWLCALNDGVHALQWGVHQTCRLDCVVPSAQDVLESRYPKLATHLESLGGGTFSFYGSWFRSFFVGWITSEVGKAAPPWTNGPHCCRGGGWRGITADVSPPSRLHLQDTFKIVDCYLSEGPKVLIRFGIAFLKLCSKELMKAMSGAA